MPNKNSKTARRAAHKVSSNAPVQRDDGTRWIIVREGRQVYPGAGITRKEAERLRDGLREPAEMVQVK